MQERLARAGAAQAKALVMRTHVSILEREPEKLPPRFRKAAVAANWIVSGSALQPTVIFESFQ